MRRLSGVLLACAMLVFPAVSHGHGDLLAQAAAPQKTTFTGDIAKAQLTYDVRYRPWYSGLGWALFGLLIFFSLAIGTVLAISALGINIPN